MKQMQGGARHPRRTGDRQEIVTAPVRAYVTGFDPFDGASSNASWEAVRQLPDVVGLVGADALVTRERIEVTFERAAVVGREALESPAPDVVLHVGMDSRARSVVLETTAHNDATARIPDNDGNRPTGRQVVPGGEPTLHATWPVSSLVGRLRAAGLPVIRSNDAGRYVCNATFYASLHAALSAPVEDEPLIGFVHVPPPETMAVERVVEVLGALVAELADVVRRRRAAVCDLGRLAVPRGERGLRLGVTGGIGSGKSTVARMLGAHGAHVVDADVLAREVVEPGTPGLAEIVEAFGPEALVPDGSLDRAGMAARVFTDPRARETLESITLPRVAQAAAERMEEAGPTGTAVYDVPLLVEGGMADLFDCVVVVESPLDLRLSRLEGRGLSRREALRRMAGQAGDAERRRIADVVLLNNGTTDDLADGVDWLWYGYLDRS